MTKDFNINKSFIKGLYVGFILALLCVSITQCLYYIKQSDMNKINSILKIIEYNYIEQFTKEDILEGLTKGIFTNLDGYSTYLTKEEFEDFISTETNNFCGIGVRWQKNEDGYCEIIRVYENGPADKVGLKKGDVVLTLNNRNLSVMSKEQIKVEMQGLKDTYLDMTILRDNAEFDYSVKREFVHIPLVLCDIVDNIGVVTIESFDGEVLIDLDVVLNKLESNNITNVIIDLRNNTGGNVDILKEIVSKFIVEDKLLFTLKECNNEEIRYRVTADTDKKYNIVILVNKYSASCSEIMAGMLQTYDLATVVGENTYGKGVVQDCIVLEDGSAIFLTTGRYYLPNGKPITENELIPDIYVKDIVSTTEDEILEKALDLFKGGA